MTIFERIFRTGRLTSVCKGIGKHETNPEKLISVPRLAGETLVDWIFRVKDMSEWGDVVLVQNEKDVVTPWEDTKESTEDDLDSIFGEQRNGRLIVHCFGQDGAGNRLSETTDEYLTTTQLCSEDGSLWLTPHWC